MNQEKRELNAVDELLKDLNGDMLILRTEHETVRCMVWHGCAPKYGLVEEEADFGIGTSEHWINFVVVKPEWSFPVGSEKYPVERWYAATLHDVTGKLNDGYKHTGVDLNVQDWPRGDVDREQPVWAVAEGVVCGTGYSDNYLGSVVIKVEHDGNPLYVRYWHLMEIPLNIEKGKKVWSGQCLGRLGDYENGDHLHFDMCLDPFEPRWWHTRHPKLRWVDPVPILKEHLEPDIVDAMLSKTD